MNWFFHCYPNQLEPTQFCVLRPLSTGKEGSLRLWVCLRSTRWSLIWFMCVVDMWYWDLQVLAGNLLRATFICFYWLLVIFLLLQSQWQQTSLSQSTTDSTSDLFLHSLVIFSYLYSFTSKDLCVLLSPFEKSKTSRETFPYQDLYRNGSFIVSFGLVSYSLSLIYGHFWEEKEVFC